MLTGTSPVEGTTAPERRGGAAAVPGVSSTTCSPRSLATSIDAVTLDGTATPGWMAICTSAPSGASLTAVTLPTSTPLSSTPKCGLMPEASAKTDEMVVGDCSGFPISEVMP